MISITINGTAYEVPSNAADTNWAAAQVAFEQAVVSNALPSGIRGTAGAADGLTGAALYYGRHSVRSVTVVSEAFAGTAATTKDITLWTLPAKTRVLRVIADVTQTFTGGSISDVDVTVGSSAGGNEYLLSFDADTATGTFGLQQGQLGASIVGATGFATTASDIVWATTTALQCRFTSVGADLEELSQGMCVFYIESCTYP